MRVTKDWIVNLTKTLLGYPRVVLEVTDDQIGQFVDNSLLAKLPTYYGTSILMKQYPGWGVAIDLSQDHVQEVIKVMEASPTFSLFGGAFDNLIEVRQNLQDFNFIDYAIFSYRRSEFESMIDRNYRFVNNKLYVDDFYGLWVAIECIKDIQSIDEISDEQSVSWIAKHTLAQTKIALGQIRRKYTIANGPFNIDGEAMVQEGMAEKKELEEQLKSADAGFFFVLR